MTESLSSTLLQLRLLVGFLGERPQCGWWPTSFFGDYSLRSLEFVTPRTPALAQYHGVVEAARRVHDEHLNVGCYHLFRLPEEVEQDLHHLMRTETGRSLTVQATRDRDSSLALIGGLASTGEGFAAPAGPVCVGEIDPLDAAAVISVIASHYQHAFSQGGKAYPYLKGVA